MAKVQVPAHWVAGNYLPPICARHGGSATSSQQRKFYTRAPSWSYLLIPIGLLIFAIVTLAIRTTVACRLPACGECAADRRRFVVGVIAVWAGTVGLIALGIAVASDPAVLLGFLLVVVALVACFTGDYFRASATVSQDRAWVTFKGVDDTFAAAITNALRPSAPVLATGAHPGAGYQPGQNILPGQ
jgi:hypothetical protein